MEHTPRAKEDVHRTGKEHPLKMKANRTRMRTLLAGSLTRALSWATDFVDPTQSEVEEHWECGHAPSGREWTVNHAGSRVHECLGTAPGRGKSRRRTCERWLKLTPPYPSGRWCTKTRQRSGISSREDHQRSDPCHGIGFEHTRVHEHTLCCLGFPLASCCVRVSRTGDVSSAKSWDNKPNGSWMCGRNLRAEVSV